jgi:hypothetical protein
VIKDMSKTQIHSTMYKRGRYYMYNFKNLKQCESFSNVVFILTNFPPIPFFCYSAKLKQT